eukprot:6072865-Pyramimonas_sp.AAC.1
MAVLCHFGTPLTRRVPLMSSTEGANGRVRMVARIISAHPSRGSWPDKELHRRLQRQVSHGGGGQ